MYGKTLLLDIRGGGAVRCEPVAFAFSGEAVSPAQPETQRKRHPLLHKGRHLAYQADILLGQRAGADAGRGTQEVGREERPGSQAAGNSGTPAPGEEGTARHRPFFDGRIARRLARNGKKRTFAAPYLTMGLFGFDSR